MSQVPQSGIFSVLVERNYKKEKREKKKKKRKKRKKERKEGERKEKERFINLNLNFQALFALPFHLLSSFSCFLLTVCYSNALENAREMLYYIHIYKSNPRAIYREQEAEQSMIVLSEVEFAVH